MINQNYSSILSKNISDSTNKSAGIGLQIGNGTVSNSSGVSSGYNASQNTNSSIGGTFGTGATATALSQAMMAEANKYNSEEAEKNRAFQAQQAEINRKWQETMSNTAYQRAMKDLKAAGLNPILAYAQGGAGTGSGASVSGAQATSAMGTAYTDNYSESHGQGSSYGENSSWENSNMTSNLANQFASILGGITSVMEGILGRTSIPATAEAIKGKVIEAQTSKGGHPYFVATKGAYKGKK